MDRSTASSKTALLLLEQYRAGDAAAAERLFRLYAPRLIQLADRNLDPRLARRVDGEDIVQSVFRTFFRRALEGELKISAADQLWLLLLTITIRKTRTHARHHRTAGRDVYRDVTAAGELDELCSDDPGPDEYLTVADLISALLKDLPPDSGEILTQLLEGRTKAEIATSVGLSRMTIYRHLQLFKTRLLTLHQDLDASGEGDSRS